LAGAVAIDRYSGECFWVEFDMNANAVTLGAVLLIVSERPQAQHVTRFTFTRTEPIVLKSFEKNTMIDRKAKPKTFFFRGTVALAYRQSEIRR
jgi:hypothetical protein